MLTVVLISPLVLPQLETVGVATMKGLGATITFMILLETAQLEAKELPEAVAKSRYEPESDRTAALILKTVSAALVIFSQIWV